MKFLAAIILITFNICLVLWIYDLYVLEENQLEKQSIDSEIKELKETQEHWIEHIERLTTISRLSFNLQLAELDKRELIRALDDALKINQQLRFLLQNENQDIFKPKDKSTK